MRRAFLIGAGATKAQIDGAPLSKDFLTRLRAMDGSLFEAIEKAASPCLRGTKLEEMDIEELMLMSKEFPRANRAHFESNVNLAIVRLLEMTTECTEEKIREHMKGDTEPTNLFHTLLIDQRLDKLADFFMTLNYDLVLDREILAIQGDIDYGIPQNLINGTHGIKVTHDTGFSLYHLHGALNWANADNGVNIFLGPQRPKNLREGFNICLVPPGEKKFPAVLNAVWSAAQSRLSRADELVIIGCSLNPKDERLVEMVKGFLGARLGRTVKAVWKGQLDVSPRLVPMENRYTHGFSLEAPPVAERYGGFTEGQAATRNMMGVFDFIFDTTGS